VVAIEKPLKRLRNDDDVNTELKPGENEIKTSEAKPITISSRNKPGRRDYNFPLRLHSAY